MYQEPNGLLEVNLDANGGITMSNTGGGHLIVLTQELEFGSKSNFTLI